MEGQAKCAKAIGVGFSGTMELCTTTTTTTMTTTTAATSAGVERCDIERRDLHDDEKVSLMSPLARHYYL